VRYADFLKATVLLSAGSATLLATLTVLGITREDDRVAVYVTAGWWVAAVAIGIAIGYVAPLVRRHRREERQQHNA
jgi:hypothetical protein